MQLQERGPRVHHWTHPKRGASPFPKPATAFERVLQCLFPWPQAVYPGMRQGSVALFKRAAARTIKDWRRGRRRAPQWARDILLTEAKKRMDALAKAIEALEAENQDPPKQKARALPGLPADPVGTR